MAGPQPDQNAMQSLLAAAESTKGEGGYPPVERWEPEYCGEMDMVIRRDGSWWHEGTRIGREKLVRLFARILRKDADGETYLVTPVEKIRIKVEAAPFVAVRIDAAGEGRDQRIAFATNMDDLIVAGPEHPLRIELSEDGEPEPYVHVRGRLEALITRAAFYDLAELAVEGETVTGETMMGVWSRGVFFALGPKA
ncbi:DUF1285 domain-containing protein [Maricaulaceae bacterium MS644]